MQQNRPDSQLGNDRLTAAGHHMAFLTALEAIFGSKNTPTSI